MKKTFLTSLTLISVIIASMLAFEATSQTTFAFDSTDFRVVNMTMPPYSNDPNCPAGGSFNPRGWEIWSNGDTIRYYRLTDTFYNQTTAMWHKQQLDLTQDFVFNFRLFFDTGKAGSSVAADGICFVLHTKDSLTTNSLIGGWQANIGYGGISPSFAVEFDTEDVHGHPTGDPNHTCYLKNGSMTALPGTYSPMQNNWHSVTAFRNWYCGAIVWKRTNGVDGTAGYDLLTYIEEKYNYAYRNEMILRNNMHFSTLNSLITGLSVDSNGRALVTWGITSATCGEPNQQHISFGGMENSNSIFTSPDTATIRIENIEPIRHTLGVDVIETACETITLPSNNDTIYYPHIICSGNPVSITLSGLDTAGAEWSVLKGSNYDSIPSGFIDINDLGLKNYDTVRVRLVLNGDTTYFVFQKGVTPLNNYFKDNRSNLGFTNNNVKLIDVDSRSQSIPLPAGICVKIVNGDNTLFEIPPYIQNDTLQFKIKENSLCSNVSVSLEDTCAICPDEVKLSFSGIQLDTVKYVTCNGLLLKFNNCGHKLTPANNLPVSYICCKYDDRGNVIYCDTGSISNQYDNLIMRKTGNYNIVCVSDINGDTLDAFDVEVTDTDISLPFEITLDRMTMKKNSNGNCEYRIKMALKAPKDMDIRNEYYLDYQRGNNNGVLLSDTGSITICRNRIYYWDYLFEVHCPTLFVPPITFQLKSKTDTNVVLCNTSVELPMCCEKNCDAECLELYTREYKASSGGLGMALDYAYELDKYYKVYIGAHTNCNKRITKIEYTNLSSAIGGTTNTAIVNPSVNSWEKLISLPCTNDSTIADVYVCVTYEDSSTCCDTLSIKYCCSNYLNQTYCSVSPNPDVSNHIVITAGLNQLPPIPLYIDIYDQFGNTVLPVTSSVPTSLILQFYPNITTLTTGIYYVVFQVESEVLTIPFTKQ